MRISSTHTRTDRQTDLGFTSSSLLATFDLPADVRLEAGLVQLTLSDRVVLAENVHQVRDVAGRQAQSLDLGQLRVGRHVGNAASQRRERRVDAVCSSTFLAIGAHTLLDHTPTTYHLHHSPRLYLEFSVRGSVMVDQGVCTQSTRDAARIFTVGGA